MFLIEDCAPTGAYITLSNTSSNRIIDLSRWVLKRHVNSSKKLQYTIPDGVRLEPDGELRIYTRSSAGTTTTTAESTLSRILVNDDIVSWGMFHIIILENYY